MRKAGLGISVLVTFLVGCGSASKVASSPTSTPSGAPAPEAVAYGGSAAEAAPGDADGEAEAPPPTASPARAAESTVAVSSKPAPAPEPASIAADKKTEAPIAREPERRAPLPQAGQLTAGVWDDNRNFDFFKPYATRMASHLSNDALFSEAELRAANAGIHAAPARRDQLDVQLLLDTTGSMGDELSYLQSEFDAIAAQIKARFPNVAPRFGLVVYRDHGDAYVTRTFDFTSDLARFRTALRAQSAAGGGDTPEAVVEGMNAAVDQSWNTSKSAAKVSFWVADAPSHRGEGQALAAAIRHAKDKGIHIYPIASSDTDDTAEYEMRVAAQMTGGRYVFLTNDSGIGNSHAEPHIPCYNVTRLDSAIVRMISIELSGRHIEAGSNDVIRSVGKPDKEGKCQLSSGMLVASY